jgi:NifB/MoaA-like Fe-S oxidoreductase
MSSVSIVPAGLTRFRDGLYPLSSFTREECAAVIDQVDAVANALYEKNGSRLFFCADEFYLGAGRELPDEDFYEGYPQLENGVGMLTSLRTEFAAWQKEEPHLRFLRPRRVTVATGVAAYPLMCEIASRMMAAFPHLTVDVYQIKNNFFGEKITVAGLLTATDIIEQLKDKPLGKTLLLPAATLRSEGDLFLDGKTVRDVERALRVRVRMVESDGYDLAAALLGKKSV